MTKVFGRFVEEKNVDPLEFTKNGVVRFFKQKRGRKPKSQKKGEENIKKGDHNEKI